MSSTQAITTTAVQAAGDFKNESSDVKYETVDYHQEAGSGGHERRSMSTPAYSTSPRTPPTAVGVSSAVDTTPKSSPRPASDDVDRLRQFADIATGLQNQNNNNDRQLDNQHQQTKHQPEHHNNQQPQKFRHSLPAVSLYSPRTHPYLQSRPRVSLQPLPFISSKPLPSSTATHPVLQSKLISSLLYSSLLASAGPPQDTPIDLSVTKKKPEALERRDSVGSVGSVGSVSSVDSDRYVKYVLLFLVNTIFFNLN